MSETTIYKMESHTFLFAEEKQLEDVLKLHFKVNLLVQVT